jgi:hypothetical protein
MTLFGCLAALDLMGEDDSREKCAWGFYSLNLNNEDEKGLRYIGTWLYD